MIGPESQGGRGEKREGEREREATKRGWGKGERQRAAVGGGGGGARELTPSLHTCPLSPALCTGIFVRTVKHAIEEAWQEKY